VARVQFPVSETLFGRQELNIFFRNVKMAYFLLVGGGRK
jgi:hypothetical protein